MSKDQISLATDQRPFTMIYHDFMDSSILNGHEKWLYVVLKRFADSSGQCFPSIETLAEMSGMSVSSVKRAIQGLEEKHVLRKDQRFKEDGGKTSNLYTLYDTREVWQVETGEEVEEVVRQQSIAEAIELLRSNGYEVQQTQKETSHVPTKVHEKSPSAKSCEVVKDNDLRVVNNSQKTDQRQGEKYALEDVKRYFDYDRIIAENNGHRDEVDSVFDILYDTLNSTKPTIRIASEDKPTGVVVGQLEKLTWQDIDSVLDQFRKVPDRMKNPRAYILTCLYNRAGSAALDITNEVSHDLNSG